jgi:DNA recombination protein RmuC
MNPLFCSPELFAYATTLGVILPLAGYFLALYRQGRHYGARLQDAALDTLRLQEQLAASAATAGRLTADLEERKRELEALLTRMEDERDARHAAERALEGAQAELRSRDSLMSEQFKALSAEILEVKAKSLQESSAVSLTAVMNPFRETLDAFRKDVQEIHHRETTAQGELRKELEQIRQLNQKMTTEAHELSTALRGQKKLQGNWGELVLENVLERSGLRLGTDYQREVSITTEEGRSRPDVVVYLPQKKHLIIDAKVSLNAYTRYVNAETEPERSEALREHAKAVESRILELSQRDYHKLPGLNSPEVVFMFIPVESAFVEAMKFDESLFAKAVQNNVLVATPTTLLTSLNIVRQLWRFEQQNEHTAALAASAQAVFDKVNAFLVSFTKVKKGLEAATEAYGKAEGQLVSGRGNLVKKVSDFRKLVPAIQGALPEYLVEKAMLEIDFVAADQAPDTEAGIGAALVTDPEPRQPSPSLDSTP